MTQPPPQVLAAYANAEEVVSAAGVTTAVDRVAVRMTLALAETNPLLVCVMNGGVPFAAALLQRLQFPLQFTHVHVSRYGAGSSGGELHWHSKPAEQLRGRHVVLIDDILDQGLTLAALTAWAKEQGAAAVSVAVLVDKQLADIMSRPVVADFAALRCEDRFLIGCGMDYQGYFRNLPAIYALNSAALENPSSQSGE